MITFEEGLITFRHKNKFNAKTQLDSRQPYVECVQHRHKLKGWEKALRGIVFQPRYHQRTLSEPQFRFKTKQEDNAEYCISALVTSRSSVINGRYAFIKSNCFQDTEYKDFRSKFYTCFKPMGCHDDIMGKVHDYMDFVSHPYTNPQPHNHRPLEKIDNSYRLRTLKTPDPLGLKFKRYMIERSNLKTPVGFVPPKKKLLSCPSTLRIRPNRKPLNTCKTPEPKYIPTKILPKGRYSPAFKAHDAFLDRIAKTIVED